MFQRPVHFWYIAIDCFHIFFVLKSGHTDSLSYVEYHPLIKFWKKAQLMRFSSTFYQKFAYLHFSCSIDLSYHISSTPQIMSLKLSKSWSPCSAEYFSFFPHPLIPIFATLNGEKPLNFPSACPLFLFHRPVHSKIFRTGQKNKLKMKAFICISSSFD